MRSRKQDARNARREAFEREMIRQMRITIGLQRLADAQYEQEVHQAYIERDAVNESDSDWLHWYYARS